MEIRFQTKEDSNKLQEEEFLKLTPSQRVEWFLAFSKYMKKFPSKTTNPKSDSFVISFEK